MLGSESVDVQVDRNSLGSRLIPDQIPDVNRGFFFEFVEASEEVEIDAVDASARVQGPARKANLAGCRLFEADQFDRAVECLTASKRAWKDIHLANALSQILREQDVVARHSGDPSETVRLWLTLPLAMRDADELAAAGGER